RGLLKRKGKYSMNPELGEVGEWLQRAKNDLLSAQILLQHDPPVLETACFHCQQTVEKALKAFLVWKQIPFEKVHSVVYLLDLCEVQEPGFTSLRDRAEALAPYAVEIRYPGQTVDISQEAAREAVVIAEAVWDFVLNLIPDQPLR
ncbi:HEPN domain-containing protein, partial [Candidatus Poribacteria bacterium]